ncbi:DUF1236 domain-containing protein [Ensifer soli]|uniref:DUF1236 domain-containing protein n=1 Tax=Ciceribacter sp. sgz301302 TaxID=3342379 RepID=UPI0035B6B4F6
MLPLAARIAGPALAASLLSGLLLTGTARAQDVEVIVTDPVIESPAVATDPSVTASTVVTVPGEVRTYVLEQDVPSIAYDGDVLIGEVLPQSVETHVIDGNGSYAYTVVNERHVVVDPQTRQVIEIIE